MTTQDFLKSIIGKDEEIIMQGTCHDCKRKVEFYAFWQDGLVKTTLPFWYIHSNIETQCFCKCEDCYIKEPLLTHFQEAEVWSRVVGYLRPIKAFNPGKKTEKAMRKDFKL